MADNSLHELLQRVREHLGSGPVDGDARQQLHALMQDIEQKLRNDAPRGAPAATPRLESLAVKFEASHPALAETLREVIDTLGKAGL
jgi:hypothetical protein